MEMSGQVWSVQVRSSRDVGEGKGSGRRSLPSATMKKSCFQEGKKIQGKVERENSVKVNGMDGPTENNIFN